MADTQITQLPDGRALAWVEVGDPKGPPVLAFHGTPGSRLQLSFDTMAIEATGVRLIALDRPGYGHSSYHRGRQLSDWPIDVAHLADHLGIDRFSVLGVSGGGPHAAVCASALGHRIEATALVSGVGPLGDPEASEGMIGFNQLVTALARRSQYLAYPFFGAMAAVCRRFPEAVAKGAPKRLPPTDAEVLQRPEVKAIFMEDFRATSKTSGMAAAQDFTLLTRDWGFRLEDITVPVHLWHGDADRNVPFSHGQLQARRIPGAVLHECPGEGHFLVVDHFAEILRTVTAG